MFALERKMTFATQLAASAAQRCPTMRKGKRELPLLRYAVPRLSTKENAFPNTPHKSPATVINSGISDRSIVRLGDHFKKAGS